MITSLGVDIIELDRVRATYERFGERFLERVLTDAERAYCKRKVDPVPSVAGRFAGKEAVAKALGTGIARGVHWRSIEIVREPSGKPGIALHGEAKRLADEAGVRAVHFSLTHGRDAAVAVAVLER